MISLGADFPAIGWPQKVGRCEALDVAVKEAEVPPTVDLVSGAGRNIAIGILHIRAVSTGGNVSGVIAHDAPCVVGRQLLVNHDSLAALLHPGDLEPQSWLGIVAADIGI